MASSTDCLRFRRGFIAVTVHIIGFGMYKKLDMIYLGLCDYKLPSVIKSVEGKYEQTCMSQNTVVAANSGRLDCKASFRLPIDTRRRIRWIGLGVNSDVRRRTSLPADMKGTAR
jgi:hypothetical protein